MRKWLDTIATGVLVCCALAMVVMTATRRLSTSGPRPSERQLKSWAWLAAAGHRSGSSAPRVTIVEFADFQCPSCERLRFALDTVLTRHASDLAVVYRHYPLRMTHQFAEAAANAAECAGQQGRFAEFANETFNHQSRIGRTPWVEFAAKSGVADTMAFNKCVTDRAFSQLIDRDVAAGDSLEIVGTPTMVINGTIVTGALTVSQLERRISEAMKRTEVAER